MEKKHLTVLSVIAPQSVRYIKWHLGTEKLILSLLNASFEGDTQK